MYLAAEDGGLYKQKFAENESLIYLNIGDTITAQCVKDDNTAKRIISFEMVK